MGKRLTSFFLAVVLLLAMSTTALAAVDDTGFSDVAADAWYADGVAYVRDNGLMTGTGDGVFSPDASTSRAMLAVILYRAAGGPEISSAAGFSDVAEGAWYAKAAHWAADRGIVTGYDDGRFGPNDPVTREQIAAILWRAAGSPAADAGVAFADESAISPYAAQAVDWARANGIVSGKPGNQFDPQGDATRAEVATILRSYLRLDTTVPEPEPDGRSVLVVYFSGSGNTASVATSLAEALHGDTFALVPETPYTSADLNWTDPDSRVNREHEDLSLRNVPLAASTVENWADYDTILLGYPIWWGIAAWPVNSFVEANDFTGKTVIPFCTSTSSSLGQSGTLLADLAGTGTWTQGHRFSERPTQGEIQSWAESLGL